MYTFFTYIRDFYDLYYILYIIYEIIYEVIFNFIIYYKITITLITLIKH